MLPGFPCLLDVSVFEPQFEQVFGHQEHALGDLLNHCLPQVLGHLVHGGGEELEEEIEDC